MPYADFPKQQTGKQEQACCNWQQGVIGLSPAQDVQKGIVLDQRIRDDKGTKKQDMFAINAHRILSIFSCAIGKNIHKFQPFQGEKADGGIKEEQSAKDH